MGLKTIVLCVSVLVLASCERDQPGPDAGVIERCCVREETKTIRLECEPGEMVLVASACTASPDAGVAASPLVTCGDGKLDPTDECEGATGCPGGSCVNCACVQTCPAVPEPNPELLCVQNEDCPEFNGQCYGCRCSEEPFLLMDDPTGDGPPVLDLARMSIGISDESVVLVPRFGAQLTPFVGQWVCVVEYTGAQLVAEVCFFMRDNLEAELRTTAGVRRLMPTEYGAMLGVFIAVKRAALPLAPGHSVFTYTRTNASSAIVDRLPDKGGVSVDRLLGTR